MQGHIEIQFKERKKTILQLPEIRLFSKHKHFLSNNFSVESQMISICLVVSVSLELCNSVEMPHSAFKASDANVPQHSCIPVFGREWESQCITVACTLVVPEKYID